MQFKRKLSKRMTYVASFTLPAEVLDAWKAVDDVVLDFNGNVLTVRPSAEDQL